MTPTIPSHSSNTSGIAVFQSQAAASASKATISSTPDPDDGVLAIS